MQQIKNVIETKSNYTKIDLGKIEMEVIYSLYGNETFFSLFAEQVMLYNVVQTQLKIYKMAKGQHHDIEEDKK